MFHKYFSLCKNDNRIHIGHYLLIFCFSMYFYCRIYFPIITNLAIICVNMEILRTCKSVFKMAMLVQYLVYCKTTSNSLINWRICVVNPPTLIFFGVF